MNRYFENLNYTMGDEDPGPEVEMLREDVPNVLAVADCGSRIVPLLSKRPRAMTCVDINRDQLALCELRIALLRAVTLPEYKQFLGYLPGMGPAKRRSIFRDLSLGPEARAIAQNMLQAIDWDALLYRGKFERMLRRLYKVNALCTGKQGRELFEQTTLQEQQTFYLERFPLRRWQTLVTALGNATALNMLLYRGSFPRKNIRESHRQVYARIFQNLMYQRVARKSFFLQMLFFGEIVYEEGLPLECDPAIFSAAKIAAQNCDISLQHRDIFSSRNGDRFDFISLSDVPSFLPKEREAQFLNALKAALSPEAQILVRSHLRRPSPDSTAFDDVTSEYPDSAKKESTQLWQFHVYRYREAQQRRATKDQGLSV